MKIELEQKLMDNFPFMRARNLWTGKLLNFAISCDCDNGWFDLIFNLCKNIQEILNKKPKNFVKGFYPLQIKEKYAGLRFYVSYGDDDIFKLIDEAEYKSNNICEICGNEGFLCIKNTWYKTLCEVHMNEMDFVKLKKEEINC